MNELNTREGGKILLPKNANPSKRIQLSNGVEMAQGLVLGLPYENYAYKPSEPWRGITEDEARGIITHEEKSNPRLTIAIVQLPEKLKENLIEFGVNTMKDSKDILQLRKKNPRKYIHLLKELHEFKNLYQTENTWVHKFGITVRVPNRETVTLKNRKMYVGLHIDSWDQATLEGLENTTNRICVNLGIQDRYLIFLNIPMRTIYEWTKDKLPINFKDQLNWRDQLVLNFFRCYPDYPIIKLRIRPFEAYIAATENFVHDGCTFGNVEPDIHMVTRGYFNVYQKTAVKI